MRYLALIAALTFSQPALAQPWFEATLSDLTACRLQAWQNCPDPVACFQTRAAAKAVCRLACEHTLEEKGRTTLRVDQFACMTDYQDRGITCDDTPAWRRAEISARIDAFDYALNEYPYLVKLTAGEIVDRVFRVAERGFIAEGGCTTVASQARSATLLYTTALAINRVRVAGAGSIKWQEAQALSLLWLRARRGY